MQNFGLYLKECRIQNTMTQKELADYLHVSDKTISSWENGRTHPDISMLVMISDFFNISLDNLFRKDTTMIKKIDSNIKMKKVYQKILIFLVILSLGFIVFFNTFKYKNAMIDRFNPFLEYQIGYATIPENVTYNDGSPYQEPNVNILSSKETAQYPDPYKNIFVMDTPFGEGNYLTFRGGKAPDQKNYVMVLHKGSYVKKIQFLDWESIPKLYQNNMSKTFDLNLPKNFSK